MKLSINVFMQLAELGWIPSSHNEFRTSFRMRGIDEPSRLFLRSSNTQNTDESELTWESNSLGSNTTVFAILTISRYLCRSK
jgi:hypothetical protein